jgi:cytochrome c553
MSLWNQPVSERAFSTFVVLALAAFLAGGLVFTLRQDRGRQAVPAAQPRLLAALEGIMAPNVSAAETETFRAWIQSGARREDFGPVEAIVANNCARCHGQGGQYPRMASFEDIRPLALDDGSHDLYAMIGTRTLHLALFPLVFLVAVFGYLRRTTWAHHWTLAGGCVVAVLFDMGQWWLRQGRPENLWTAWMAAAALAVSMSALVAVVLRNLWGPEAP